MVIHVFLVLLYKEQAHCPVWAGTFGRENLKMSLSDRYHRTYPVSWEQLQRDCRTLAWRLVDKQWKRIVGIARGGLVPAAILARELDVHLVDTVCMSSYLLREQGEVKILEKIDFSGDLSHTLIVDDLVDTGRTAAKLREITKGATFVTVYAKPMGEHYVDSFITEVPQDTWVLFPWDAGSNYVDPIAGLRETGIGPKK